MTDEERLADLLLLWEEGFERGEDVPAESLCRDCPELATSLAGDIQALKSVAWVKRQSDQGAANSDNLLRYFNQSHFTRRAQLRGVNGSFKGEEWLGASLLRVGRLDCLEIVLDDNSVSRFHA